MVECCLLCLASLPAWLGADRRRCAAAGGCRAMTATAIVAAAQRQQQTQQQQRQQQQCCWAAVRLLVPTLALVRPLYATWMLLRPLSRGLLLENGLQGLCCAGKLALPGAIIWFAQRHLCLHCTRSGPNRWPHTETRAARSRHSSLLVIWVTWRMDIRRCLQNNAGQAATAQNCGS